jgi:hypothetical protein
MPWETPQNTLDTNMTKAILADEAYTSVAALMQELAAEGGEAASQFAAGYEQLHVASGPFQLALSLGAMSEAIMDLRSRVEALETQSE